MGFRSQLDLHLQPHPFLLSQAQSYDDCGPAAASATEEHYTPPPFPQRRHGRQIYYTDKIKVS